MTSVTPFRRHRGLYAFFHEGKYYVFFNDDNERKQEQRDRADIVEILQEGGTELLDTLRTVFDFVEVGVSIRDGGDSSAIVRENPNPEWEKAFAKICLYFTRENFPAFSKLEMVDLGFDGRLISRNTDEKIDTIYAIDLDNVFFHECTSILNNNYFVASHPIEGLTNNILQKLRNQNAIEDGFFSQSFPLPNEYKKAIVDDLFNQGYQFCSEVKKSYAPILWRVIERATGCERCIHIFLSPLSEQPFCTPFHKRHMTVAELLMNNPHPHLVHVRKKLTIHGNPAVVIDSYDSDLETARENLSRQQMNCVISQVVKGIIYLHQHGFVHHDIKPSNILINFKIQTNGDETVNADLSSDGMVEAVIYDFQSVSIPCGRYQTPGNDQQFHWKLISKPQSHEELRHHLYDDDRWLSGWAPIKTAFRFLRRDFRTVNPWAIDCSSVAMMFLLNNIEIYETYQKSSIADYRDHPEFSVFFNAVKLFQSQAQTAHDAIDELKATLRTFSDMKASDMNDVFLKQT